MRAHSGWTRARLDQGKPRLDQGTTGAGLAVACCGNCGTRAGHEQGGSAAGAHGNGGSGLGRRGSGSGRQYWCRAWLGQWGLWSRQWRLKVGGGGGGDEDECPPAPPFPLIL